MSDKKITKKLINLARVEREVYDIINGNNLNNETSYLFFTQNHRNDLTYYKQEKHSGFNYIVLYRGVYLACFDFLHPYSAKIKTLKEVKVWDVYNTEELKRKVLSSLMSDPWDNRKRLAYKPVAEKMWTIIEQLLQ